MWLIVYVAFLVWVVVAAVLAVCLGTAISRSTLEEEAAELRRRPERNRQVHNGRLHPPASSNREPPHAGLAQPRARSTNRNDHAAGPFG